MFKKFVVLKLIQQLLSLCQKFRVKLDRRVYQDQKGHQGKL